MEFYMYLARTTFIFRALAPVRGKEICPNSDPPYVTWHVLDVAVQPHE